MHKILFSTLALACLISCAGLQKPNSPEASGQVFQQNAPASGLERYLSGSAQDIKIALNGPNLLLGGGGRDVVAAMQWQIDSLRGCRDCEKKIDMVVLRSSGADGYNSMLTELKGLDSIETLVIKDRKIAENPDIALTVANAEMIFFAGGDQCDYVRLFKGTAIERAVKSVFARRGGIGGTSAGLAIQGSLVYDACSGSVTSAQALANPYHPSISFSQNFFDWPILKYTITDTHFSQRDRMGRLFAFLARGLKDTDAPALQAIAVDEATAMGIDPNGLATVFGQNHVYFVVANHPAKVALPNLALSYSGFQIKRLNPGQVFDLKLRPQTGAYTISVEQGQLSGNPY
jgi:cyanophycinase